MSLSRIPSTLDPLDPLTSGPERQQNSHLTKCRRRSINAYLGPAAGRSDTKSLATSPALLFVVSHRGRKLPVIYRDQSSSKAQASVDTARTDATAGPTGTAHQLNVDHDIINQHRS
ncbi:hypothetical protein FPOAC1_000722 [Fusarium poae]|uniref:hypothetical protein n=1 Tax=Fusarium poae TaxID=36050 RepID=UPI001CE9D571|nr:hypothetical protein FPOAC1_000722 [Fusarium poae]KAG8674750.1 hypothetical protein FPOAC1_000722 [Fusarium poae]